VVRTPPPARRALIGTATVITGVLATVLALGGCGGGATASSGTSNVADQVGTVMFKAGSRPAAPQFSGTTLTGTSFSSASDKGSAVVINWWGSWCSDCRQEAPALTALAKKYQANGVKFLGIDIADSSANAEAYMRTFGITYPSLNDPGDTIALDFRATVPTQAVPFTLVIDRTGHIAGRVIGQDTYSGLDAILAKVTGGSA
jgi:thiol-disulfide isomerase/thioredoxin